MTGTAPLPAYWPLVQALNDCLCQLLATSTIGGPVGKCCPIPGNTLVLDDCCAGTGWVRLVRIDPVVAGATTTGGIPSLPTDWAGNNCGPNLAQVVIGMGVVRCSFSLDEHAEPPSCEELSFETQRMFSDIDALYTAALCCDADVDVTDVQPLSVSPQGPEGGCVGAELQVAYTMDLCPCGEVDDNGSRNSFRP